MIEIRHLRHLLAIVEEGSISAAASRLEMAQPSLSQSLARMETELGVHLLARGPRGVLLTDAGRALARHARTIVRSMEEAVAEVEGLGLDVRGHVSIGLPSSACGIMTVPLAETVRETLPHVSLRILEAMSGHIGAWIQDGSTDLGLLYDVPAGGGLKVTPIATEDLFLVCAPDDWPVTADERGIVPTSIDFTDLAGQNIVLPSRIHSLRRFIGDFEQQTRTQLTVPLEIDSQSQIKRLVAQASYRSILSQAAVHEEAARGEIVLVPIRNPTLRRTIYLVRSLDALPTRAMLEVEKLMIDVTRELVQRNRWSALLLSQP